MFRVILKHHTFLMNGLKQYGFLRPEEIKFPMIVFPKIPMLRGFTNFPHAFSNRLFAYAYVFALINSMPIVF